MYSELANSWCKVVTLKDPAIGRKTVWFVPKCTNSSSTKIVTSILKLMSNVATIDIQDDDDVVIVAKDDEVTD